MRMGWLLVLGCLLAFGEEAVASGGVVKLKTDNGPDGYYYNANGSARGRYCAFYDSGEFDSQAIICGIRLFDLDRSIITLGVDDYTLGGDLRSEDANNAGYADISTAGLLAVTDFGSRGSCSTTGAARTYTFGGGAGVSDPLTRFLLTCPQPANNNLAEGADFCGILLDTSSLFVNSARTQAYSVSDTPFFASIGFNHFVEAIVFEPKLQDLRLRMTGSSAYPGSSLKPCPPPPAKVVVVGGRACNPLSVDCCVDNSDTGPINTTDDFITTRITLDNNTSSPISSNLLIESDRSPINPKLGPKDVTLFFRPCGGGAPIMNPLTLPSRSRTSFCMEIKTKIKRKFLGSFPVELPFVARAVDPNTLVQLDSERRIIGLRQSAGYFDNDSHSGGYFFSQTPVVTGDALGVEFFAIDLQNRSNTATPYRISGIQVVGGEFGASGLPGIDGAEIRTEDLVLLGQPDLSPGGLFRRVRTVGDPGNADGIPFGLPATTVNIDFTDIVVTPGDFALAPNFFALVYLNPGDTGASVTAIGAASGGETFVGQSILLSGSGLPVLPFRQEDLEIRIDMAGELGNPRNFVGGTGYSIVGQSKKRSEKALLREYGQHIALDDYGNRIED